MVTVQARIAHSALKSIMLLMDDFGQPQIAASIIVFGQVTIQNCRQCRHNTQTDSHC